MVHIYTYPHSVSIETRRLHCPFFVWCCRKQDLWQITIDFSPKGGPKDFIGYWDADGIKFPATATFSKENRWPKVC